MNHSRSDGSRRLTRVFLTALLVSSYSPVYAQNPPGGPGAPQPPPYQWPRSREYHVQHYKIELGVDLVKKSIKGETTMTLRPFKTGMKEVELDAGDMTIGSVRLSGGAELKYRYQGNEKLFVALDREYPADRDISITVAYSAAPKKGLTFIAPTESEPARPYQVWSQGEAVTNHYWFPCYDYPNDKATAETIVTVDEKYQVVSNGELVGVRRDSSKKTRTWHWRMDKPFSSYLASIIVGEFAEVKDRFKSIPVVSYVYPDQVENARLSLGKIGQMVAFFSERVGYDYPYAKYAETTVRDFPGGMENISATTMGDGAVHDKRAALDVSSDGLISHELAHQWFGDLLTCRDWGEIWLNESFATFFANLWEEHDKGQDDYLYGMRDNRQQYYQAWFRGLRRPVVTSRYDEPDAVFDTYAYARGGATLNMLRFVLGEELFWKAINHYVKKYQWQNVDTAEFVDAIEEATGQNLQWFFDEWIYKMGHPEFEITSNYDAAAGRLKLAVKQTQKPDEKRPWFHSPEFFRMPVDIAVTTSSGEKINRVWIDKPEMEFVFSVDSRPLIVNFDRGDHIIKTVKFNRGQEELAYQLLHDSDVMGRVRAATEIKSDHTDAAARALGQAATGDKFWGARVEAAKALSEFKTDASRAALLEAVKDKDSRVRRSAIQGLAAFKDPKLADLYIDIIKSDPSYFAAADAGRALGQSRAPQAYGALTDMLKLDSWQETIRGGAMAGLASLGDSRALEVAFKYAAPGNPPALRRAAFSVLGEAGKGSDRALAALTGALKEHSFQLIFSALQALGALGDPRAIPAIEELKKRPDIPGPAMQFVDGQINRIKNSNKAAADKK